MNMTEGRKPASIRRPIPESRPRVEPLIAPPITPGPTPSSSEHSTPHHVNINTFTREMTISPKPIDDRIFFKRHPIVTWTIFAPIAVILFLIMIMMTIGVAMVIAHPASSDQITIQRTDSWYQDCTAFAQARGFAVEVCDPLNTSDFNDGFSTAKQDDCQQGDTNACAWLKTTKN